MIARLRAWYQEWSGEEEGSALDGDTPAFLISMFVHMGIFISLAFVGGAMIAKPRAVVEITTIEPEQAEKMLETPDEFYFSNQQEDAIGANSSGGGSGAAFALGSVISDVSAVPMLPVSSDTSKVAINAENIQVGPVNETVKISTGPHFSANVAVRGAAGMGTTGAVGAIDRLTHEILLSLEERKTLVVWMFDQSGSLAQQRSVVNQRFDRIFEELGVIEASGNPAFKKHDSKPLLNAVVAFGDKVSFPIERPTDNLYEIKNAVAGIQTDTTGVERVFTAVYQSVEKYRNYRTQSPKRNVMFVIFSDEVGDDEDGLDTTVAMCRKVEIPVYCVGVPAPFGRREVQMKYVPPAPAPDDKTEYDLSPQWAVVRQGPESFLPEMVNLSMSSSEEKGAENAMDSGFGPYSLTRLCYETGGIYFTVHPNRNVNREVSRQETAELSSRLKYFFDPEVMRNYRPDYVSINEYKKLVSENKARQALVEAAHESSLAPMRDPVLEFPKTTEAEFANALSKAQQVAAVLEPVVNKLFDTLKIGEKDRARLTQPRWQAGYDLAMGRVMAVKVRTEAYNAMLAKAKQGMKFKDEKNDTWVLVPADEISVGSALEKQKEQAKAYLTRVVTDHKDTPWAMLAAKELETPLGWRWEEKNTGVQAAKENAGGGGGNANPANDKKMMMKRPPKKPPLPKL